MKSGHAVVIAKIALQCLKHLVIEIDKFASNY